MPTSMLVALWLRDTYVNRQGESTPDRLAGLRTALDKADEWRRSYRPARRWAKPQVLFVAPEYLFAQPAGFSQNGRDRRLSYTPDPGPDPVRTQQRHLDEEAAKRLILELRTTSARYPDMLIVPGTIAWEKKFTDLVARDPGIANKLLKRIVGLHHRLQPKLPMTRPMADPVDSSAAPLRHAGSSYQQKIDALRAVNELAVKAAHQPLQPDEQQHLDAARLCKNTALVLRKGKTEFVYSKQGDFHEVLSSQDASRAFEIAIPGQKDGFFDVGGVHYGIEICFDHALGALRHPAGGSSGDRPPQIQIITSAAVEVDVLHPAVAPNGYVLNASCDQNPSYEDNLSGLWVNDHPAGRLRKLDPIVQLLDVAGYPMWLYEIVLP